MNDVFYIFVGSRNFTRKCSDILFYFIVLSKNQNASPHEVGVIGPVAFQSD
jgi:hypothetical protein